LSIEHVKEVSYNQTNAGLEESAHAEEETTTNIEGDSNNRQNVWVNVPIGEPPHHRVNNSLAASAYARSKHSAFPLCGHYA
jgi:hypothetical protein